MDMPSDEDVEALRREHAALTERLAAFETAYRATLAEVCSMGEGGLVAQHCACVPHLWRRIQELEATWQAIDTLLRMRDEATYHADPPALPLEERVSQELQVEYRRGRREAIGACLMALRERAATWPGPDYEVRVDRRMAILDDACFLERKVQP
jgi:hypothetical protein